MSTKPPIHDLVRSMTTSELVREIVRDEMLRLLMPEVADSDAAVTEPAMVQIEHELNHRMMRRGWL